MMKILKPLIFTVCLVVVFAIGYSLGPGKAETVVDNTDELTRLQAALNKKNTALVSLQASLDTLKSEQVAMRKSIAESEAKHEAKMSARMKDQYTASNTDVGDLNFYNDLPKQKVQPEPLQADPKKFAAAASPSVTPIAGTSSKPLAANQVLTPSVKKIEHKAAVKHRPLPARYIPPGFKSGKIPAPKKAKAKEIKKTTHSKASFMVQMGSFKSNKATEKLRKQLRKQGYTVHVKKADVKGKSVFRVMIGSYPSGAKAKLARAALKKKMGISGLVIKNK